MTTVFVMLILSFVYVMKCVDLSYHQLLLLLLLLVNYIFIFVFRRRGIPKGLW